MGAIYKRESTAKKYEGKRKPKVTYRAEVRMKGPDGKTHYATKTFKTNAEAESWITIEEAKILNGGRHEKAAAMTVADAFAEYRDKVSCRPGAAGERRRISSWLTGKEALAFRDMPLAGVREGDILGWRDARLQCFVPDKHRPGVTKTISSSTVRREWNIMSAVFSYAVERHWIERSPMPRGRRGKSPRPSDGPARRRRVTEDEIGAIYAAAKLQPDAPVRFHRQRAALAMELGVETAMRAGEMCSLTRDRIDLERGVAILRPEDTKTKEGREVALSLRAREILKRLLDHSPDDRPLPLSSHALSRLSTNLRRKAGIVGLTLHDGRGEATTRMAKILELPALAAQTGHKDLRMLMVYYRETAADRAARLG